MGLLNGLLVLQVEGGGAMVIDADLDHSVNSITVGGVHSHTNVVYIQNLPWTPKNHVLLI